MTKVQKIEQLNADFTNQRAPFNGATLPEKEALSRVQANDELAFLTFGVSLDYNRSADQLWDNCIELYEDYGPEFFDAEYVVNNESKDSLSEIFGEIGFRYRNRDASGWYDNSEILVNEFDSSWWEFLKRADFDAPRLTNMLEVYGFKYLKGDKLAPFYAKVVDANITSLERVWELPIPVDVHIRRLTQDLSGIKMTDDEIRDFWERYGKERDIDAMAVDTALWLIGNQWDDWGSSYWEAL